MGVTYNIDRSIEPHSSLQVELEVTVLFKISRVSIEGGQGVILQKVTTAGGTSLWAKPIELFKVPAALNLFRPRVAAGLLTFDLMNPTNKSVHFKITIQ